MLLKQDLSHINYYHWPSLFTIDVGVKSRWIKYIIQLNTPNYIKCEKPLYKIGHMLQKT